VIALLSCVLAICGDVVLAPIPATRLPAPGTQPVACRLERGTSVSECLADVDQTVEYPFRARSGEDVLLGLEAFGYERGWRSGARIRVVDANGSVLSDEVRRGPVVWHQLTAFHAPLDGEYRYRVTSVDRPFRYRVTRRERARAPDGVHERLESRERIASFTRSAADVVSYDVDLEGGEEVFVKVTNSEEAGRKERRAFFPPRLGEGSVGGFVFATFEFTIHLDDVELVPHQRATWFRAPRRGTYAIRVATHAPGAAGLFDLEVQRRVRRIPLCGSVRDREDVGVAGACLTFQHGIDRDVIGFVRTAADGSFAIDVPPGRLRIRVDGVPNPTEIDAVVDEARSLVIVP